jgi:hypothetical protein
LLNIHSILLLLLLVGQQNEMRILTQDCQDCPFSVNIENETVLSPKMAIKKWQSKMAIITWFDEE